MQTFAIFGVGLGNLGIYARKRIEKSRWIADLNRGLNEASLPVTVIGSYGHTGNFIIQSISERNGIRDAMSKVLGTSCVVLSESNLEALVEALKKLEVPPASSDTRFTPGVAMQVNGPPLEAVPVATTRACYFAFSDTIVLALKNDILTSTGVLDRNRRSGGWGGVSGGVQQQFGGQWTARSGRTISGLLRRMKDAKEHQVT